MTLKIYYIIKNIYYIYMYVLHIHDSSHMYYIIYYALYTAAAVHVYIYNNLK